MRASVMLSIVALFCVAQPQVFRTRTDLVRIDALVEHEGRPLTTLTERDFIVKDNGVVQRVTTAREIESVSLGIVMDVSGSMIGDRLEKSAMALDALLASLEQGDRYHAFAFADQVRSPGMSTSKGDRPADRLRAVAPDGHTALADAAYAAIVESDTGPGPKLLLIMTDGCNNVSWLHGQHVIDAARRRETVIYPVAVGVAPEAKDDLPEHQLALLPGGDGLALLRILARETGGRVITAEWTSNLAEVFKSILREYRQRYLLTFAPEGVGTDDGWHTLDVRLRRGVKGDVHARGGYLATP